MTKIQRAFCQTIFIFKALAAVVLGVFVMGYQVDLVVKRYQNSIKPLPNVDFPPIGSAGASKCFYTPSQTARLEPPQDSFFFGFSPKWINGELPEDLVRQLGYTPPIFNSFITMVNPTNFEKELILWNVQKVKELGGILSLTLSPNVPVDQLSPNFYTDLALYLRQMNQLGVPILLRWIHEMNGNWMVFGNQPTAQINSWRMLATAIRRQTNMTALLWSPNISAAYGQRRVTDTPELSQKQPRISPADFQLLDTNRDNVLDNRDDPYLPYYPGDEFVDWVGISLYSYARNNDGSGAPPIVPSDFITSQLINTPSNFYPRFVQQKGKPFIISETGAPLVSNLPGQAVTVTRQTNTAAVLAGKRSWWNAIFSQSIGTTNSPLKNLKAAIWFEYSKEEGDFTIPSITVNKDFRITSNPEVRDAFLKDLQALGGKMTAPGKFKFSCDGKFSIQ